MTPEQERDAALRALTDPERARAIEREQQVERELAPGEKRSIGKLGRDLFGPVLGAIKRALGWP